MCFQHLAFSKTPARKLFHTCNMKILGIKTIISALLLSIFLIRRIFLLSVSPQIITSALLRISLIVALLSALRHTSSWLSLLFILTIIGGLLVLFSYIVTLSGHPRPGQSTPQKKIIFAIRTFSLFIYLFCPLLILTFSSMTTEFSKKWNFSEFIFSSNLGFLYIYLFLYLLLALIFINFLLKTHSSPLRNIDSEEFQVS